MSVQNGEAVSAEVTNAGFLSRKTASTTVAQVGLQKPTGSGAFITDLQKVLNTFISLIGMLDETTNALEYGSNYFVTDGTSLKEAIGDLDAACEAAMNSAANLLATNNTWTGSQTFQGAISYSAYEDSVATGADQILNVPSTTVLALTDSALTSVAGILEPPGPRFLIVQNASSSGVFLLKHLSPAAPAGQKIMTGSNSDVRVGPGAATMLYYDVVNSVWVLMGGAGGGGGSGGAGSINWNAPAGDGAVLLEEDGLKVYNFTPDPFGKIVAMVQVPSSFGQGNQPKLRILSYSGDTNYHAFKVTTTLLKPTLSEAGDVTWQHVANIDSGGVAVPGIIRAVDVELSDIDGKIDSEDILADDYLKIEIERATPVLTPVSTTDVKVLFGSMGVTFE